MIRPFPRVVDQKSCLPWDSWCCSNILCLIYHLWRSFIIPRRQQNSLLLKETGSKQKTFTPLQPSWLHAVTQKLFLGFQKNVFNKSRWEKARVGWFDLRWFERIAMKHVYYHMWNRWPVQVWCTKQETQSWCTWDNPWDGEEDGRGFRMGHTCTPRADSCQCMAKPLQYCKAISLQLK